MSTSIAVDRPHVIALVPAPCHAAPEATSTGACHACLAGQALPACQSAPAAGPYPAPHLSGIELEVQQLLTALRRDLAQHAAALLPAHEWLDTLNLRTDEAELRLTVPAHCGGVLLADAVFQSLRRLLPGRDLYVLPAP